jgi:hypothetical protein
MATSNARSIRFMVTDRSHSSKASRLRDHSEIGDRIVGRVCVQMQRDFFKVPGRSISTISIGNDDRGRRSRPRPCGQRVACSDSRA